MRILVVNDDGIGSAGICCLADLAMQLGEVWVAAPEGQCSAMSHRISVYGAINVKRENDFPVRGVRAYRIGGTPADCVKVALDHLMPEKPDLVFSGINHGYNVGVDILYSGTVGAAMEALVNGIPAMAFSSDDNRDRRVPDRYLIPVVKDLLSREIGGNQIWNINFPSGDPRDVKGILRDRLICPKSAYETVYTPLEGQGEDVKLAVSSIRQSEAPEGTDMAAVFGGYISIGKVDSGVLAGKRLV